jgi:hypothetical protein
MNYKRILYFPRLVFQIFSQIVYYTLTEADTFLLALVSVLWGLQEGWLWGLIVFFSVYLAIRLAGMYIGLLASKLHRLSEVMDKENQ